MKIPDDPAQTQAWLELPDGTLHWLLQECRIGRIEKINDLVIDDRAVSSRHAHLVFEAGSYTLIDQHSTNGTYLNGLLVQKATQLKDGDEIRLAKIFTLRFRCTRELQSAGPVVFDEKTTAQINQVDPRECWLLLADVVGYSGLIATLGSEAALGQLQTWIAEVRPQIEGNGGSINSYVGDAIFAYWPCRLRSPEQVLGALSALEDYRARSPVIFRTVLHHGIVLFTRSSRGEEISGQEVNFIFRSEKIAKRFACFAMFSQTAVTSLHLEGRSDRIGTSSVDGINGEFSFYGRPRDPASNRQPPTGPRRILLVEESSGDGDGSAELIKAAGSGELGERAQHGASARRLHALHNPHLVIIELSQRTGETLALVRDLVEADPQTQIIVISTVSDPEYIKRSVQAGVRGYVLKSDPPGQLPEAIRVVSGGGMFLSEQIAAGKTWNNNTDDKGP